MANWIGLMMRAVYYYCHLIGLTNFDYEPRTGRVYKSWKTTFYTATVNTAITVLAYHWTGQMDSSLFGNVNELQEYVIVFMSGLRIIGGLVTLLNRWRQRKQLMELVRNILRLYVANPNMNSLSRWGFLVKFFTTLAVDLVSIILAVDVTGRVSLAQALALFLQFWTSSILNLAILQHYLVILFVRVQYQLMNTELRNIIEESERLCSLPRRRAAFMTRCCYLSDQLEDIAKLQSQLQLIVSQVGKVFGIQGLVVYSGYYLFSVVFSYLTYSLFKNGSKNLDLALRTIILGYSLNFFYYLDAMLNLFNVLLVLDDHKEMLRLLAKRTLFSSGLDVRLEESFESFQLQVARNPFEMNVMQLFPVNHYSTTAMCGSIITHSILLIQYDMENF
ncbi:putative gustatory receptor 36b [Drosophila rhopaloa]|uniref:Gustatory receptor n=1 Tax=Drosophila rhopaloa TaxID=1041015 RepID=A0ABM5HNG2_DRORH|nr:putative gustatory receptor 36b [Drosophila rhopaloa]